MKDDLTDILASCLEVIERGECSLEECLTLYPEQREALETLLSIAMSARAGASYAPRPGFRQASRARLLNRLTPRRPVTFWRAPRLTRQKTQPIFVRRFIMPWIVILALVASLVSGGTVYASGDALPGDALYPVKLAVEDAQLLLSGDGGDVALYIEFLQTRMDEIQALIEAGREDELPLAMEPFSKQISATAETIAAVARHDAERAAQLALLLEEALSIHTEVLTGLLETVPDQAKPAIQNAILASSKGRQVIEELFAEGMPGGGPPEGIPGPPEEIPGRPDFVPGDNPRDAGPPVTPPTPAGRPPWVPGGRP